MKKRKICFVTGTRAEYGLMSRLMKRVAGDASLQLQIVASNMHLSPEFGLTYKEIENDGFTIDKKVDMLLSGDTCTAAVKSLGVGLIGLADAYADLQPDLIVLLGDRYETLGAAEAALFYRIPVAHISGGDTTEGAYDDAIRHSITKMSHLHFPSTEVYRKRIIQLGEQPDRVWNVGNMAIDNIRHMSLMSRAEIETSIGFKLNSPTVMVTFHPVTLEEATAGAQCGALLAALDKTGYNIIFTLPNSDTGGHDVIRLIGNYVVAHPQKAIAFKSMGYLRYLSALQFVTMVLGNSSSGIVEVPSFGIPTVNIGDRQKGRLRADSVIDCEPTEEAIAKAIAKADELAKELKSTPVLNPYEQPDSVEKIYGVIKSYPLDNLIKKHFYDL